MRTTITLDPDIYDAAMHVARGSGQRLGKVISELARRGLQREPAPKRPMESAFPVVQVPPGTPVIAASRVQRYLDDEGYF